METYMSTKWKPRRKGCVFGTFSLLKLNEEKTDNLNRQITKNEIESVIKKKSLQNNSRIG